MVVVACCELGCDAFGETGGVGINCAPVEKSCRGSGGVGIRCALVSVCEALAGLVSILFVICLSLEYSNAKIQICESENGGTSGDKREKRHTVQNSQRPIPPFHDVVVEGASSAKRAIRFLACAGVPGRAHCKSEKARS